MRAGPWRLPGYRVERLIGAGGYGDVWQARVRATDATVAVKRIPLTDPQQRQAALSEAAVLSGLDHPHLVHLHKVVHVDDAIVLVLDLAAAGSLARLLAARGRLTPGETITALGPIAAALAHAHSAGVVHGDVTPANVLFTEIGLPLLGDLGVARLLGDHVPVRTTPEYADPTVGAGYLPSPASDVFMLGCVALQTLTGQPPCDGPPPSDLIAAARWHEAARRRLDAAGVPPEMTAVVLRALTLDPDRRGTAAEFALDLRHSGRPVAVELTAGRSRTEPSLARLAAIAAGRPNGDVTPLPASALPFTHGARVPSPLVRREPRHRSSVRSWALSAPVAVILVALGLVAAALVWWPSGANSRRIEQTARPTASQLTAPSSTPPRSRSAPGSRAWPRVEPGSPGLDAAHARHVLERLDATRSAAFAAREPSLFRNVYASPALVARDTALLDTAVPIGCGLHDVRTRFTDVRVIGRDANIVRVRVRAVLDRSSLVCGDTAAATASGAVATLRIALVRTATGYRIRAQLTD